MSTPRPTARPTVRPTVRHGHRTRGPGVLDVARSLTASGALVVRRRARRDALLLLWLGGLVAVSAFLALAGPRVVLATIDSGAQDVVATAGARASVLFRVPTGDNEGYSTLGATVTPTDAFRTLAEDLPGGLPPGLRRVGSGVTASVLGPAVALAARDGVPDVHSDADGEVWVRVGMLPGTGDVELVDGDLPDGAGELPVQVLVPEAAAQAAGLQVGTTLTLDAEGASLGGPDYGTVGLVVVGIVQPDDAATTVSTDPPWADLPELWTPYLREGTSARAAYTRITVLTDEAGLSAASRQLAVPFTGTIRMRTDPSAFTAAVAAQVATEIDELRTNPRLVAGDSGAAVTVVSELDAELRAYPPQARAALAQMSVMIAGVIGVGAVVVILLSRLLVARRSGAIALERARGASVPAVGLRLAAESLVVTALGAAAGWVAAALGVPGPTDDVLPLVVVLLAAFLAPPLQGMWTARRAWTGRREPANRQDRLRLHKQRLARRLVAEAGAVVLAVGAVVSLRGRGVLQTRTTGIDPFLAAAPLLLALAVTVVLLRLYPWPVRAAGVIGRRTRGALGLLGAVRAQRAVAALPLLALTLGMALAVGGGLIVGAVRTGQTEASWQRVGADVRIEADVPADEVARLAAEPGVTAVGSGRFQSSITLKLGTSSERVTLLAVDAGYADVLAQRPDLADAKRIPTQLPTSTSAGAPLPVVVDSSLIERVVGDDLAMYIGRAYVPITVAASADPAEVGYLDGPFVYVDLDSLNARMETPEVADMVWVVGPGAADAAATLSVGQAAVVSRAEWLQVRRDLALIAGVEQMMVLAVGAVALLAVVALVATVLAGARERGRSLSLLRTLGMNPRLGWWLALAELAPVVLAAAVGGVAAGVAIVLFLAPALGLRLLAGGVTTPAPSISPEVIAGLAGGAVTLLLLAVLVEVLAHRRDQLSDVLRVGETV